MKPIVHFTVTPFCEVGEPAYVYPVDHYGLGVSNKTMAITTPVVSKVVNDLDQVLEFETKNTQYKRLGL